MSLTFHCTMCTEATRLISTFNTFYSLFHLGAMKHCCFAKSNLDQWCALFHWLAGVPASHGWSCQQDWCLLTVADSLEWTTLLCTLDECGKGEKIVVTKLSAMALWNLDQVWYANMSFSLKHFTNEQLTSGAKHSCQWKHSNSQ